MTADATESASILLSWLRSEGKVTPVQQPYKHECGVSVESAALRAVNTTERYEESGMMESVCEHSHLVTGVRLRMLLSAADNKNGCYFFRSWWPLTTGGEG